MLTCTFCRTENADDARLCRECGKVLTARDLATGAAPAPADAGQASGTAVGVAACPHCGQSVTSDAQFCPACGKNLEGEYAGFWRRLGGFLIDAVIVNVVTFILAAMVGASIGGPASLVISFSYIVFLNASGGTLGMKALGMRLERDDTGENIGVGRSIIRYIVAIASGLVILLGYLWCIWDEKKQTWHDKAAGSVVVRT